MLVRLIDFLQDEQITVMFTALSLNTATNEQTDEGVSSLVDAWLLVRDLEANGERNRGLYVMKSRGMKHSNQVREFLITDEGLSLVDVYMGPGGAPEGVLACAALRCVGGQFKGRLLFRNDDERGRAAKWGITDLDKQYDLSELAKGDCIFAATGVTDGSLLAGVKRKKGKMTTESVVMRASSGTVRWVKGEHRTD